MRYSPEATEKFRRAYRLAQFKAGAISVLRFALYAVVLSVGVWMLSAWAKNWQNDFRGSALQQTIATVDDITIHDDEDTGERSYLFTLNSKQWRSQTRSSKDSLPFHAKVRAYYRVGRSGLVKIEAVEALK